MRKVIIVGFVFLMISCRPGGPDIRMGYEKCQPCDYSYIALMELQGVNLDVLKRETLIAEIDKLFCLVLKEKISFERFKKILFQLDFDLMNDVITVEELDILKYLSDENIK